MSRMRSKLKWAGLLAVCGVSVITLRVAWATPSQGLSTTIITGPVTLGDIDLKSKSDVHDVKMKTKGDSDVYIVDNIITPGGSTGWHSHPGISFVNVRAGVVTEYHADEPNVPHIYPAGTGFTEEAGAVHIMRNEGTTNLELVAFQLIPSGATRRIDQPAP